MYFKISSFSGVAPAVDNVFGEQFGQTAENIDFESGALALQKQTVLMLRLVMEQDRLCIFMRLM